LVFGYLDALRINPESVPYKGGLTWQFALIGLEKEALAIAEPNPMVLRMFGRPVDAVTIAQAHSAEDLISLPTRRELGLALASAGDYASARPILEENWQQSGGRITAFHSGVFGANSAAALIAARRNAGEEVSQLLAAIRDNARRYREAEMSAAGIMGHNGFYSADYEEGLAAYLSGERDRGLVLIAKAVEDGYFIMPREAYLQALYDDPGFAPIRAMQQARQARERDRFLTIACSENPYAAVWQPAEGTCERFAGAGGN
jgi:hypothetical protein